MDNKIKAREWFYSQEKKDVPECGKCDKIKVYRLGYTGQYIFEMEIDSGLGGEICEIDQITDIHFNYVSIADEADKEVMGTRAVRKWNREAESVKSAIKAMDVAAYADQTVITGDVLDFLSRGCIGLMKKHILDRDDEVLVTLGGHELTKQMETYLPDETPIEERYAMLAEIWPHDMFYHSKDVGDKVIAVCLDNSRGLFCECQIEKLENDIKRAREEKKIILVFAHEPIATRRYEGAIPAMWEMRGAGKAFDFDGENCVGSKPSDDEATKKVYALITENADVIKGFFCGHRHSAFYTEISATYEDENGKHQATIPQWAAPGNPYLGHVGMVTRIIVK